MRGEKKKTKNKKQQKRTRFICWNADTTSGLPFSEARLHFNVLKVSWGGQIGAGGKSVG